MTISDPMPFFFLSSPADAVLFIDAIIERTDEKRKTKERATMKHGANTECAQRKDTPMSEIAKTIRLLACVAEQRVLMLRCAGDLRNANMTR